MIQTTRRELDVPIDTRSLAPLREFVREVLSEGKLAEKVARQVVIAIDEACSSIILNAKEQGATVIEINPEPGVAAVADVVLAGPSGEVAPALVRAVTDLLG